MPNIKFQIRPAKRSDCPSLVSLKKELALHQDMQGKPMLSANDIEKDGFDSSPPAFHCLIAESESNEIVGFALYFYGYCVKTGKILHLEDFCVTQTIRGSGIGSALFQELAKISVKDGCSRMQLEVLEWNLTGIKFYDKHHGTNVSLGEEALHTFKFDQDDIRKLANLA